jgi:hypothetical protein
MSSRILTLCLISLLAVAGHTAPAPHPVNNPSSPLMLAGEGIPADTHQIDFDRLPRVRAIHSVVNDVMAAGGDRVNQHNYLVHHAGRFWAMWSDGPGVNRGYGKVPGHDRADQHVYFATSPDGLNWTVFGTLTGAPDPGFGWIARGFWVREGRLLALVSRYKAPGYHGEGLSLQAFEWTGEDGAPAWLHRGLVFDDALNNFPPKKLPDGEWLMSRRDQHQAVHFLRGGVAGFDRWQSFPVAAYREGDLAAEEPYWWVLPDRNLMALYRDNAGSGYLFRAFSTDNGRTWTKAVRTNFPDAKSKFHGLRLQDGRYLLVSNANPKRRDPLTLAVSRDGLVFHALGYLAGGRHVDYPHMIEHDGAVYVAFATAKQTVEVLKIDLREIDRLEGTL